MDKCNTSRYQGLLHYLVSIMFMALFWIQTKRFKLMVYTQTLVNKRAARTKITVQSLDPVTDRVSALSVYEEALAEWLSCLVRN